jgi:hypothetical protein
MVPVTTGAQNLADRLRLNRKWMRVKVGKQQAGDVGVCFSQSNDVSGADHIYLVVEPQGDDKMLIADNQVQGQAHIRYASGKGGKTPTEYFLRASDSSGIKVLAKEFGADEVDDDQTNMLPEPFMDDGSARMDIAD